MRKRNFLGLVLIEVVLLTAGLAAVYLRDGTEAKAPAMDPRVAVTGAFTKLTEQKTNKTALVLTSNSRTQSGDFTIEVSVEALNDYAVRRGRITIRVGIPGAGAGASALVPCEIVYDEQTVYYRVVAERAAQFGGAKWLRLTNSAVAAAPESPEHAATAVTVAGRAKIGSVEVTRYRVDLDP